MIYIIYDDSVLSSAGIWKKIQAQYRVFKKQFGNAYYTLYRGQMMCLYRDDKLLERELAITKKECNEAIGKWVEKYKISRIYIRIYSVDRQDILFCARMNERNAKVVVEFPTLLKNPSIVDSKIVMAEDQYYRNQMHKYVKCCTTYHNVNSAYEIPCIALVNGVDMDEQPLKKYRKRDGRIILLAVATFSKWHGYERVIEGLHKYYLEGGKRNIIFNLVGKGGQLGYYEYLVNKYELQAHVNFCGEMYGKKLEQIYDDSDIAIGSLGFYKTDTLSGAPIKSREYCARGIPFLYGYDDVYFDKDCYFVQKVSNDESPVDIEELIRFYDTMYDGRDFINDMRQYAMATQTWDKILQPVIDYYRE